MPDETSLLLMMATRKGSFMLRATPGRDRFQLEGPQFLGHVVHHIVLDPRDRRTMLMAASTGHLGPTVFRSTDSGGSWQEAERPPQFAKAAAGGRRSAPWITCSGSRPAMPTSRASGTPAPRRRACSAPRMPAARWDGCCRPERPSDARYLDRRRTGRHAGRAEIAFGPDRSARSAAHVYVGMSSGGVFASDDQGAALAADEPRLDWPKFRPDPYPEYGQDPHRVALHPLRPDRLYQQNHCGIYRMDLPEETLGAHRRAHADRGRRYRTSAGAASARS